MIIISTNLIFSKKILELPPPLSLPPPLDGNDDAAPLDEDNTSDEGSILDEVIRNNEESYHH